MQYNEIDRAVKVIEKSALADQTPAVLTNRHGSFTIHGDGLLTRIGEADHKEGENPQWLKSSVPDQTPIGAEEKPSVAVVISWLGIGIITGLLIAGIIYLATN